MSALAVLRRNARLPASGVFASGFEGAANYLKFLEDNPDKTQRIVRSR
jgi:hypothetical protein